MKDDACEHLYWERADPQRSLFSSAVLPDTPRMRRWLASAPVASDGAILSWVNNQHPGHAYCEAAGLWLSHTCAASDSVGDRERSARVAGWLASQVGPSGGVGRGGRVYAFDSAVALRGLLAWRCANGSGMLDHAIYALHGFLVKAIEEGVAVRPPAEGEPRWSECFAPHLMKVALALNAFAQAFGGSPAPLFRRLVDVVGAWSEEGDPVYVHAFCYALEGRIALTALGVAGAADGVADALERLARFQRVDGGMPAYLSAAGVDSEARCDATAQAVRLWILGADSRHDADIRRALAFLARQQAAAGGVRYAPGCEDLNVWTTIFTLQAVDWATRGGACILDLV